MDISEMKNPKFYTNVYYHCTKKNKQIKCSQGVIDETELEKTIREELGKVEISTDFYRWAVSALKYMHGGEMETQDEVIERLQKKEKSLKDRLNKHVVMRADGEISAEQLAQFSTDTEAVLIEVEKEQRRIHSRISEWVKSADKYLTFADTVVNRFNRAGISEKRIMLETLGSTLELLDKNYVLSCQMS